MSVPPGYLSNAELAARVQEQTDTVKQFKDEQTHLYTTEELTAVVTSAEGVPVVVPSWKKVAVDAGGVREDLAAENGAAMVGYKAPFLGAESTDLSRKFLDLISPADFQAHRGSSGSVQSQLEAFARAPALGPYMATVVDIRIPEDFDSAASALASLRQKILPKDVKFRVVIEGKHELSAPLVVNDNLENVDIVGEDPVEVEIQSTGSISGFAGAYSIVYEVDDATGIEVGDYAIIRGTGSVAWSPDHGPHWGCWEITGVSGNNVTVTNTCRHSSMPNADMADATMTVLKTILTFPDTDGLCLAPEANIGTIDNLVLVGGGSGTGADYGIVVGYRQGVKPSHATSNIRTSAASARINKNVGVSGWDRSGIWVGYGSSLYCEGGMSSCNNGEHGIEADTGGFITMGWYTLRPSFNGNAASGVLAYNCAGIWAGSAMVCCGNGQAGVAAITSSAIVLGNPGLMACYNLNGVVSENGSAVEGSGYTARYNRADGLRAAFGGTLRADSSVASNNTGRGAYSAYGTVVSITGATLNGNGSHGAYAVAGEMLANNAQARDNGGRGFVSESGRIFATTASASGNVSYDFVAIKNGTIYANLSRGADGSTGARYLAQDHGYIDALNSIQAGATYSPAYNCSGSRGSLIVLKDIQQLGINSRSEHVLANGATSYTPNMENGSYHKVAFTGAASFAVAAATNHRGQSVDLTLEIRNNNGSTAVTPSFDSSYKITGVSPIAAGKTSTFRFTTYDGTRFVCVGSTENHE